MYLSESFSITSDGLHVFVFNSGELYKFTSGLGGHVSVSTFRRRDPNLISE